MNDSQIELYCKVLNAPWNLPPPSPPSALPFEAVAASFQHSPIDHSQPSIRLIHIERDLTPDGFIQCRIFNATTDAPYSCLSYMWGTSPPSRTIVINGKLFRVRGNLYDFLVVARLRRMPGQWLWIDALCINQEDVAERNHQVQQMGQIYRNARMVIIWLGNLRVGSIIPEIRLHTRFCPRESFMEQPDDFTRWCIYEEWISKYPYAIESEVLWNRYWGRAWVAQEILLAEMSTVLVGLEDISLADLFLAALDLYIGVLDHNGMSRQVLHSWLLEMRHSNRVFYHIMKLRFNFEQQKGIRRYDPKQSNLSGLLWNLSDRQCALSQDQLFSLLELCKNKVVVDYGIPGLDLVYQVLKHQEHGSCLCSASLLARRLTVHSTGQSLMNQSLATCHPHIEFDVLEQYHEIESSLPILHIICPIATTSFREQYPEFNIRTYHFDRVCSSWDSCLLFNEHDGPEIQSPVWHQVFSQTSRGVKHAHQSTIICYYGKDFSVTPKPLYICLGESLKQVFTVRIALAVFCRINGIIGPPCQFAETMSSQVRFVLE